MKPLDPTLSSSLNDFVTQWFTEANGASRWFYNPKAPFRFESTWSASHVLELLKKLLVPASEMFLASDTDGWLTSSDLSELSRVLCEQHWRDELYIFQTPYEWLVAMTPKGVLLQGKATRFALTASGAISDITPEHLFRFQYRSPSDSLSNDRHLADRECAWAFVVLADKVAEALAWGEMVANQFVKHLYAKAGVAKRTAWRQDGFAFGIADSHLPGISREWYAKLERVKHGELPDFTKWA